MVDRTTSSTLSTPRADVQPAVSEDLADVASADPRVAARRVVDLLAGSGPGARWQVAKGLSSRIAQLAEQDRDEPAGRFLAELSKLDPHFASVLIADSLDIIGSWDVDADDLIRAFRDGGGALASLEMRAYFKAISVYHLDRAVDGVRKELIATTVDVRRRYLGLGVTSGSRPEDGTLAALSSPGSATVRAGRAAPMLPELALLRLHVGAMSVSSVQEAWKFASGDTADVVPADAVCEIILQLRLAWLEEQGSINARPENYRINLASQACTHLLESMSATVRTDATLDAIVLAVSTMLNVPARKVRAAMDHPKGHTPGTASAPSASPSTREGSGNAQPAQINPRAASLLLARAFGEDARDVLEGLVATAVTDPSLAARQVVDFLEDDSRLSDSTPGARGVAITRIAMGVLQLLQSEMKLSPEERRGLYSAVAEQNSAKAIVISAGGPLLHDVLHVDDGMVVGSDRADVKYEGGGDAKRTVTLQELAQTKLNQLDWQKAASTNASPFDLATVRARVHGMADHSKPGTVFEAVSDYLKAYYVHNGPDVHYVGYELGERVRDAQAIVDDLLLLPDGRRILDCEGYHYIVSSLLRDIDGVSTYAVETDGHVTTAIVAEKEDGPSLFLANNDRMMAAPGGISADPLSPDALGWIYEAAHGRDSASFLTIGKTQADTRRALRDSPPADGMPSLHLFEGTGRPPVSIDRDRLELSWIAVATAQGWDTGLSRHEFYPAFVEYNAGPH